MKRPLRIAVGADHGGFELKQGLVPYLRSLGHAVDDCGTHGTESVDYPRFAYAVARKVASDECQFGIMVDAAGIGSAMAAGKVQGVRAAACYTEALARNSREHNDANVLTLGSGQTSLDEAKSIVSAFLDSECTVDRHQRRVQLIMDIEQGRTGNVLPADAGGSTPQEVDMDLSSEDVERIANRVKELMAGANAPATEASPTPPPIDPAALAQMIDHTMLKPEASRGDIERLCQEAITHNFFSVCVNPSYVRQCRELLNGTGVKVCCVVGFPLGAQAPEIKAMEARKAIREGAREIDTVINVGALKSGDDDLVLKDIRGVVEACKERSVLCKVILETSLLSNDEKVRACELSMKARADFVKTSTGFGSGGATEEDIRLMSQTVAPKKLGVKASGGVRTYADALKMIQAGATRIGASSSVKILEEAKESLK